MNGTRVFVLLTLSSLCTGFQYDGLIVKYGMSNIGINETYFFTIPRTIQDAKAEGFNITLRPEGPMAELQMYCPRGAVVCPLYHPSSEFVAGLQIAAPVNTIDPKLNPEKYFVKWTLPDSEPAQEFWTATQYYYTSDTGAGPTKENGSTLQYGGVWVKGLDGKLLKILEAETEINNTIFKKQACIPNMGMHYYYNMTKELKCDLPMLPWFGLVADGNLLGVGFQTFGGKVAVNTSDQRDFFEDIPREPKTIPLAAIPNAPECFLDYSQNYGRLSVHIYYISKPWELRCKTADLAVPVWQESTSTTASATAAKFTKSTNNADHLVNNIQRLVLIALGLLWPSVY